ncbi:hypothetical protein [Massilia sp. CF038]|uniref:hypothetical protein n=1 Tax=Massilia sp. CF038 TaxID=1881045 RepID=UPI000922E16F|nr:hypothetical protein [Massilia sp. CF038]SHG35120.1 hypothetical protein SAMN05428948_0030 [Massilia sp. CF038]
MHARTSPFYSDAPLYFILLLLTALVGFFPSYYSKLGSGQFAHQFHGAIATLWMLLLIGQSYLMRQRKLALHRAVGKASIVLAALFVVSGLMIVHAMLTGEGGFSRRFGPRLAFVDISSVGFFVFAYLMAIVHRRDVQLHARYMSCTALPLLPPALSRALGHFVMPDGATFAQAFHLSYLAAALIAVALIVNDWRAGKVRAPYVILLVLLLLQQASYEVSMAIGPWKSLVSLLAGRPLD